MGHYIFFSPGIYAKRLLVIPFAPLSRLLRRRIRTLSGLTLVMQYCNLMNFPSESATASRLDAFCVTRTTIIASQENAKKENIGFRCCCHILMAKRGRDRGGELMVGERIWQTGTKTTKRYTRAFGVPNSNEMSCNNYGIKKKGRSMWVDKTISGEILVLHLSCFQYTIIILNILPGIVTILLHIQLLILLFDFSNGLSSHPGTSSNPHPLVIGGNKWLFLLANEGIEEKLLRRCSF